jgi:hypothetical protein
MTGTRFVGVIHLPVDPAPEPVREGRVRGHRRGPARALLRSIEAVAFAAGLALVAGIVAYVAGSGPQTGTGRWIDPYTTAPSAAAGGPCAFDPCPGPTYTGEPTRLRIPAIGVDTPLEKLDLDSHHELQPPKSYDKAGWWRGGVLPGETGAAVVAGHVDSYAGPAVFYKLSTLRGGDVVEIRRGKTWVRFTVTTVERYPKNKFPDQRVYQPTPGPELRLITCGGDFDRDRRSYRDNIVVYAILTTS